MILEIEIARDPNPDVVADDAGATEIEDRLPLADRGIDQGIPRARSTSRGVILMRGKEKGDRR